MNKKALHILEYEKIIDMLVREADSDPGKDKCRHLKPITRRDEIVVLQSQTGAAFNRILKTDKPSFHGLRDIRHSLKPLEKEGFLTMSELLDICRLFEIAKDASDSDEKLGDDHSDVLSGQFGALTYIPELVSEINRCIISEE